MNRTFKIYAKRAEFWGDGIEVFIGEVSDTGQTSRVSIGLPICMKVLDEPDAVYPHLPTLTLTKDGGQKLMDELWNVGIRPTEGTGSAGSLAATERHLADMRALAANALKTKLP